MQVVKLYTSTALLTKCIAESITRLVCALEHLQSGNIFPCAGFAVMAATSLRRTEQTSHNLHYSRKVCQSSYLMRGPECPKMKAA